MCSRAEEPSGTARARLVEAGEAIAAGVEQLGPDYLVRTAGRVVDAWGSVAPEERSRLDDALGTAARAACARVARELRELSAAPVAAQRATPLELVRSLPREPSRVLAGAGIPPVDRDPFEAAAAPADLYALAPRSLADLGDPELGPLHLAWGMAKARLARP